VTLATPVPFYRTLIEKRAEVVKRAIEDVSGKQIEAVAVKVFEPATAQSE
jgi:hypothetical protein